METSLQLVIPMSGVGARFLEAGYKDPKPLIDVDGHPMISHVLSLFPGVKDVHFVCNDLHLRSTQMREVLTTLCPSGTVHSVSVDNRRGPVDAVMQISNFIANEKEVIVSYCDYGSVWDFNEFLSYIRSRKSDGSIACYTGFHPHMLGRDNYAFLRVDGHRVLEVKEKEPFTSDRMSEFASNGTYYFRTGELLKKYFSRTVERGPVINGEFYVSVVYNHMIKDNLNVSLFPVDMMLQWGTPYDLEVYKGWSRYFADVIEPRDPAGEIDEIVTVIPMAGRGNRFVEKGYSLPKPFLDVNGSPMFSQAVDCLPKTKEYVFICLDEHISKFSVKDAVAKSYRNANIVSVPKTTSGQACTCEFGIQKSAVAEETSIIISACDNAALYDERKFRVLLQDLSVDIIVWSFRNSQASKSNPDMYSWLEVDCNDFVRRVSCKKFIYEDPLKTHAIVGTMFFRKSKYFLDGLRKNKEMEITTIGEYYVDDVISRNLEMGLKIKVFEVDHYVCWGTPDDYEVYNYWRGFFNQCQWHPYRLELDRTLKH